VAGGLTARHFLDTALAALAVALGFTLLLAWLDLREFRQDLAASIGTVFATITQPAAKAVYEIDGRALGIVLDGALGERLIEQVAVSDEAGRLVDRRGRVPDPGGDLPRWLTDTLLGAGLQAMSRPLVQERPQGPLVVGVLELAIDRGFATGRFLARFGRSVAAVFVQSLVLGAIMAAVAQATLGRPIRRLSEALLDLQPESLGLRHRLPGRRRDDELGAMVRRIESLLDRIVAARTVREQAEVELRESEARFRDLAEGSLQGMVVHRDFRPLFVNDAHARALGYGDAATFMAQVPDLLDLIPADIREAVVERYRDIIAGRVVPVAHRIANRNRHGAIRHFLVLDRAIDWGGEPALQVSLIDISREVQVEAELSRLATRDGLTGLANRALIHETLATAVAQAAAFNRRLWVVTIDIDRFKDINDSFGHPGGDSLLRKIARRLEARLRPGMTLGRLGADEFVVLAADLAWDGSETAWLQELAQAFSRPFTLAGQEVFVRGAFGIAAYPENGTVVDDLLRGAHTAANAAKRQGAGFVFYDAAMNLRARNRLRLERDLRREIDQDGFTVHYQPQQDIATGEITGFEALLRWKGADGVAIPPDQFIPVAEETGMIVALGELVLERVCRRAAAWRQQYCRQPSVAVNVSPLQLLDPGFADRVVERLARHGLPATAIEIEITETATIAHIEQVLPALRQLRDAGIALAIDDFGTGYSSLSYLKRLPLSCLKLDKSFVRDLPDAEAMTIARAIVVLGHQLGLSVTAEGVETEAQRRLLTELGYDRLQGYLIGRPTPDSELVRFLDPPTAA
jgi:diguanylate cyclase (GGDEF)-like protein/PAS domain S-box-containing protein